jgi:hypothetical protein
MKKMKREIMPTLICVLIVSAGIAHGQTPASRNAAQSSENQFTNLLAQARPQRRAGFGLMPSYNLTPTAAGASRESFPRPLLPTAAPTPCSGS